MYEFCVFCGAHLETIQYHPHNKCEYCDDFEAQEKARKEELVAPTLKGIKLPDSVKL